MNFKNPSNLARKERANIVDPDRVFPDLPPDSMLDPKSPNPSPSEGLLKAAGNDEMSREEKIALAKKEVEQAEVMVGVNQKATDEWRRLLVLRRDNLERIKKS